MRYINFRQWLKEQAAPASPVSTASNSGSSTPDSSGSTLSNDVAKVPTRIGCGQNCSKDFYKNWHHKKRKK